MSWLGATDEAAIEGQDLLEVETEKVNMTGQAEAVRVLEILVGRAR